MSKTSVVVHPDATALAAAVAARLIVAVVDAQAARGSAAVVLTGGRVARAVLKAVRDSPAAASVDWARVDLWWGDERFLPAGDPERNETQARDALLDALPLDPARVHPMPASDGPDGPDAEAAARRYAATLAAVGAAGAGAAGTDLPHLDVLMLGVGEDGHVASMFPGHPAGQRSGTAVAVHDSPKPPPTRISLTLSAIGTAHEVWLIAAGPDKADAVGAALNGTGPHRLPAAAVAGVQATRWLLDRAAAAHVTAGR